MEGTNADQIWKEAGRRGALMILLGSPELSNDQRVWQHVDPARQEIDFSKILSDTSFNAGQRILIEIAASLFDQDHKVNLWDSFKRLDSQNAKLAITAICNFARSHGLDNPIWSKSTRRQKTDSRKR